MYKNNYLCSSKKIAVKSKNYTKTKSYIQNYVRLQIRKQ